MLDDKIIFLDPENMGIDTDFIIIRAEITILRLYSIIGLMAATIIDIIQGCMMVKHNSR